MSLKEIQQTIEKFISTSHNDLLVIKGNWGVGKTYFWQNLIKKALNTNLKLNNRIDLEKSHYAYVSLFGLSSPEELRDTILSKTIFTKDSEGKLSKLNQLASNFGINAKKSKQIHDLFGDLLTTLAFNDIRDTLICFDDIERRTKTLDLDYVLGLANYLKEERDCKIVIILNENSLHADEKLIFRKHIEKVADIEISFALQPIESINCIFANNFPYYEIIKNNCLKLGIKNLRILKRIKLYIEYLSPFLQTCEEEVKEEIIASIILFAWSYYDKDNNPPNFEFIKKFTHSALYIAKNYGEKKVSEQDEKWYHLLSGYNFNHTEEMDEILISYIQAGYLQTDEFKRLLAEKNKIALANFGGKSYRQAWNIYNDSFKNNQQEFAETLTNKFKENSAYLSLDNLQTTVETLRELGYDNYADEIIDYHLQNNISEQEISKYLKNSFNDKRDEAIIKKLKSYQSKTISKRSIPEITDELKYRNGWSDKDIIELDSFSEDEYYNFFKNYEGDDLYYRVKSCLQFGKYTNGNEMYKSISNKAENALKKIAQENKLNKIRVFNLFGISID
ncbi:MAG TPA: P-loop NTPase fold protein [Pyrinomonadaceae bacterium]|jgi:hypothetical protein